MSLQSQKSSRGKLSWLEKKMHSSRSRILRRIFHFLHFYVRPLLLTLIALFLAAAFFMLATSFRFLRSSPKGFQPVIRITVLDWLQARALARSAKASEAKNDFAAAKMAWQLATGNDRGNPQWPRGWLANIMHEKPSWKLRRDTTAYSSQLLWFSPTNRADFALVANALEHCRLYRDVLDLFEFEEDSVSSQETAPLLRSLFHLDDYKAFRDRWSSLQLQTPHIDWLEDPLMKLYHLGTKAILENDPSSRDALNEAVAAISPSSPHYAQAQRIALRVAVADGAVPRQPENFGRPSPKQRSHPPGYSTVLAIADYRGNAEGDRARFGKQRAPPSPNKRPSACCKRLQTPALSKKCRRRRRN